MNNWERPWCFQALMLDFCGRYSPWCHIYDKSARKRTTTGYINTNGKNEITHPSSGKNLLWKTKSTPNKIPARALYQEIFFLGADCGKKRIIYSFRSQILDRLVATKFWLRATIPAISSIPHDPLCLVHELHDWLASFSGIWAFWQVPWRCNIRGLKTIIQLQLYFVEE